MADEVVGPGQIADEVLEQLMRFRRVPDSRQGPGGSGAES